MASAICDGDARNSALSTRKRLISSHSSNPPATDRMPAKYLGCSALPRRGVEAESTGRDSGGLTVLTPSLVTLMAVSYALIGNLRHARQQQSVDRKTGGKITEDMQCIDHVVDFSLGHLAGRLEQVLVVEEAVSLFHIVLADLAHVHLQLDRGVVIGRVVEPGDALVVAIQKALEHVAIRRSPIAVHRHAGKRHVGQIVEGEAEIGVARGLGVK